jgi:hypothetical protein
MAYRSDSLFTETCPVGAWRGRATSIPRTDDGALCHFIPTVRTRPRLRKECLAELYSSEGRHELIPNQ